MDIKRMHDMIEKLSEVAKCEFDNGIENVDTCEMGKVVDMMKDLSEAMYYRTLTKAMDELDPEEILEMFERYGDGGRRHYDHYRYADGKFAQKGSGTYRRGYDEPPHYHMTPEKYHEMEDVRDMDRDKYGRMHYTEPSKMDMHMNESNYDRAKRNYTETKELHKSNTPEDKEHNLKSLEKYMTEIARDISGMVNNNMSTEEKTLAKTKLTALVNMIQ